MTPRAAGRSSPCGRPEANTRLDHANKYQEVADLVATEGDDIPASASVAASLAVLAGIAAADAAPKSNQEVVKQLSPSRGCST